MTAVKGKEQKEFSIPTLKVCTWRWTFLHDLGQLTEAKAELLDQGGLGSLTCPTGQQSLPAQLLPVTRTSHSLPVSLAH